MESKDETPPEAKDYYSRQIWWSETVGDFNKIGVNGIYFDVGKNYYGYNSQEIVTPETSETFEKLRSLTSSTNSRSKVNISEVVNEEEDYGSYSRQILSTEIVEIVEDGKSITDSKNRRVDDLYVAVGENDLDVVKWTLDHAVSPGSRIFLVHVSPPITSIPTPVGMIERSQLAPPQVRRYLNEVNIKRKDLLHKYIQLSTEAKVTAETLILESKHTEKAILDLISILNITNLVMGIKKLPYTRGNDKLSNGEFVKKNAPKNCDVTLVYNGDMFVPDPYMDGFIYAGLEAQNKDHSKRHFFRCTCFSSKSS